MFGRFICLYYLATKLRDMELKNYVRGLVEFLENNPNLENAIVVYSKDEEGNGFEEVLYTPTKGYYEDREFTEKEYFDELGMKNEDVNAVCIN